MSVSAAVSEAKRKTLAEKAGEYSKTLVATSTRPNATSIKGQSLAQVGFPFFGILSFIFSILFPAYPTIYALESI